MSGDRTQRQTAQILWRRFRQAHEERGAVRAVREQAELFAKVLLTPVYARTRGQRTFEFDGKSHRYFCHYYNTTFDNERAVEVPIVLDAIAGVRGGGRVLEVGNVLSHYTRPTWDVLDKYESAPGIINEDAATFRPAAPYDLIVSISTLEHVGFDEQPRDPSKIGRTVESLRAALTPTGRLIATLPVGYNPDLDRALSEETIFDAQHYLRRASRSNAWVPVEKEVALQTRFDQPYPFGNALVIGIAELPRG